MGLVCVRLGSDGHSREIYDDGVYLSVLCKRCNNRYGSILGTAFTEFARQFQNSGTLASPHGGVLVSALGFFPSRVLRHLYLNYLCVQPVSERKDWDSIRQLSNRRDTLFPPMPQGSSYISIRHRRIVSFPFVPLARLMAQNAIGTAQKLLHPVLAFCSASPT